MSVTPADGGVATIQSQSSNIAQSKPVTPATATVTVASLPRVCSSCGRGGAISRCSKCLGVYYCSPQCQAAHWPKHKPTCVRIDPTTNNANTKYARPVIPANSAAVVPPASSSASTRSSVAHATTSGSVTGGKDLTQSVPATISVSPHISLIPAAAVGGTGIPAAAMQHNLHQHSHAGNGGSPGHSHSHGHGGGHSHGHSHSHACSNPNCPHHGHAARSSPHPTNASTNAISAATSAANSSVLPTASPTLTPVHSQTSYSPVPVSNVSASSRHIYVPPCRPAFKPSFLHFPQSSGPPLSCIHGFHTNLLFSPEPVRILYADLVDPRHVLQSLVDLHTKMKAWKKKMNAGGGGGDKSGGSGGSKQRKASELPLPTPPSIASKGNPNIGIEFHCNDSNPHLLSRGILFLVSAYMSSAVMNASLATSTAANFGIQLPPQCVWSQNPILLQQQQQQQQQQNGTATPAASPSTPPTPIPILSSYTSWTPSDHWSYLFQLFGCYQMPIPFLRRLRETLELLVRLSGQQTFHQIANVMAANGKESGITAGVVSAQQQAAPVLTQADATCFSQHPYTFFLHLPALTLSVLLPIWKSWEEACRLALVEADRIALLGGEEIAKSTVEKQFSFPSSIEPLFTEKDLLTAHPSPSDAPLRDALDLFYRRGCVKIEQSMFPATHQMKSHQEIEKLYVQQQQAIDSSTNGDGESDVNDGKLPLIPELYPPSREAYSNVDSFSLTPTLIPLNSAVGSAFQNPAFAPLIGASGVAGAGSPAAAEPNAHSSHILDGARIAQETNLSWIFAREPFSMLLPKLSSGASSAMTTKGKDLTTDDSQPSNQLLPSCLELMSKMSHALFWVVGFQQSSLQPGGAGAVSPVNNQQQQSKPKVPYVRLYFYNHDLYFHLHTYDFLYDRILVYHLPEGVGMQSLILMARHRMKNQESLLETNMNFQAAWKKPTLSSNEKDISSSATSTGVIDPRPTAIDLHQFCLLSLNANLKLIRNIFGWDLQVYTYPTNGSVVLRFLVCDYSLDLSAPTPLPAAFSSTSIGTDLAPHGDGFRIVHDWLMTAIQPILLHDSVASLTESTVQDLARTSPRSTCNLRTFCQLIGLLVKQGHLDQTLSRTRMVQLFAALFQPNGPYQIDHLFTSLITHIGLLKAELLPLMYLLLTPLEETPMEVLAHNSLFFKGLWQLELVSMKFEPLVNGAFQSQQQRQKEDQLAVRSASALGEATGTGVTTGAAPADTSSGPGKVTVISLPSAPLPFEPVCRLCHVAGPNHCHHLSHGVLPGGVNATTLQPPLVKDALLSLLFVTAPSACPTPVSAFSPSGGLVGSSQPASPSHAASSAGTGTGTGSVSPTQHGPFIPGSVPADSPMSWVNFRGSQLQSFLRQTGRAAQVMDVVDMDWSTGIVTAWMNRTYVNYVRKCSSFAQVCVIDFEQLKVLAPPRSVVHLKTMRSMNIR